MLSKFINQLTLAAFNLERSIYFVLRGHYFPDGIYPKTEENLNIVDNNSYSTSLPIFNPQNDTVLWAVPKKRRSTEKRLSRRFGWPHQVWKPLVPKKNLVICKSCGSHFEAGFLCPTCYSKVKTETEDMQKKIEEEIGLKPHDREVMILYEGEDNQENGFSKSKRVVEITRKRPQWFSKNLLEKTSKGLATTLNVKPSDLG